MNGNRIIGKEWKHPTTGEVRYYIDVVEAVKFNGLNVEFYNTGNICYAELDGVEISNTKARNILADVEKIWYTEDGKVHIKYDRFNRGENNHPEFWAGVVQAIEDAIREVA